MIAILATLGLRHPARAEPPSLTIATGLDESYETNIYRLSRAEKAIAGVRSIDDIVVNPQARLTMRVPVSLQAIELGGGAGYGFHRYNKNLDSEDLDAYARLRWQVSDVCDGLVGYERTRSQADLEDLGGTRGIIQTGRSFNASGGCEILPGTAARISYLHDIQRNHDPLRVRIDLDETTLDGRFSRGWAETGQIFALVRHRVRGVPDRPSAPATPNVHASIWDAGGGIEWKPSELLSVSATLFNTDLRESSGRRDGNSLGSDVSIDWSVTAKTRLHLFAQKGVELSPNINAVVFTARTLGGDLSWEATPRLTATLKLQNRRRFILRDVTPAPAVRAERDSTLSLHGVLDYAFSDRLGMRIAGGYARRDANFPDLRFESASATLGLAYRFSRPREEAPTP